MITFNSNITSPKLIPEKKETSKNILEAKVWNAERVKQAEEDLSKGRDNPFGCPFFEKRIGIKKENIVYEYSEEELSELKKCKDDIIHFAETYCQIKTEKGQWTHFKLRPYQKTFLKNVTGPNAWRFFIYLSSRQVGKCLLPNIYITIKDPSGKVKDYLLLDFYYEFVETEFLGKVKKWLWKIYSKLES